MRSLEFLFRWTSRPLLSSLPNKSITVSPLTTRHFVTFSLLSLSHSLSPLLSTNTNTSTRANNQNFSPTTFATRRRIFAMSDKQVAVTDNTVALRCNVDHPLRYMGENLDYSWIHQLSPEDDTSKHNPETNNVKRRVKNGHYVLVTPKPLKNPKLIAYSSDITTNILQLSDEQVQSEEFVDFFSGNAKKAFQNCVASNDKGKVTDNDSNFELSQPLQSWATPYALSIMGTRYTSNCPFGTGEGYGDGRAISIAELSYPHKYEFQLKGGGPTPFCRGADGRAVLRSSIREFLASEAMHHLGIGTTRALSLILSEAPNGDESQRPWYREAVDDNVTVRLPDMSDPRLAMYPPEKRKVIIEQLAKQKRDPDIMISEPNAITCRVSPSFIRIGHLDLFARRVLKTYDKKTKSYDIQSPAWKELEQIVWHTGYRDLSVEKYEHLRSSKSIVLLVNEILDHSCRSISKMVTNWIRVGFCQGNFNADNCLVAGRTMDYGPFGFMDKYDPLFAKWTGSGEHFGFLNQPRAALVNYVVLVESLLPLLMKEKGASIDSDEGHDVKEKWLMKAQAVFQKDLDQMWMKKLGLDVESKCTDFDPNDLWAEMEALLQKSTTDWTLIWRQLYQVIKEFPVTGSNISTDYEAMFEVINGNEISDPGSSPFYKPVDIETRKEWIEWIKNWRGALVSTYSKTESSISAEQQMRLVNPKYVLREWMLVEAYQKAAKGDYDEIHSLLRLTEHPYEEGTSTQHSLYYKRAPDDALISGGTAFMS